MPAFERLNRVDVSSPSLNLAEQDWWNRHASLIERIWGLPAGICRAARSTYLKEIRADLHRRLGDKRLRVLEIACGSGWPGRLMADESTTITGIDFSEEQVRLARESAKIENARFCDYEQLDIAALQGKLNGNAYDAAFVHCGLHHLSSQELRAFRDQTATIRPGFVLTLVEPVYFDKRNPLGRIFYLAGEVFYRSLRKLAWGSLALDPGVTQRTEALMKESEAARWFLSPKEMPFTRKEITGLFSEAYKVEKIEPVTFYGLRAGQDLAQLQDVKAAERIAARWIPWLNRLDQLLIRLRLLPMMTNNYLFSHIFMVRK